MADSVIYPPAKRFGFNNQLGAWCGNLLYTLDQSPCPAGQRWFGIHPEAGKTFLSNKKIRLELIKQIQTEYRKYTFCEQWLLMYRPNLSGSTRLS